MFKAGERVIHHRYGKGGLVYSESHHYPLLYISDAHNGHRCTLLVDGREHENDLYQSIFYKEQTFDMSKPEPEIGTWGYFWDSNEDSCALWAELCEIDNARPQKYKRKELNRLGGWYINFSTDIPPHIKELMNVDNVETEKK